MMTKLKIQYDNFETGEFTEEITVDKETLLTIFEENTKIVDFHKTYTINKPLIKFYLTTGENYLCVMHFTKDVFTVWYCNDPDTKLYEGKFYKESILKILELFIDKKFNELNNLIPKTKKKEKSLIKTFVTEDFIYMFKKRSVYFLILNSALMLPFHLIFFYSLFINYNLFIAISTSLFPIINLLLFKLHLNYLKHSRNTSIKVSSGSPNIKVINKNGAFEFTKDDILQILYIKGSKNRIGFSEYGFSRIILHDNRTFDITFMIIEPYQLEYKMGEVSKKHITKFYPYIK